MKSKEVFKVQRKDAQDWYLHIFKKYDTESDLGFVLITHSLLDTNLRELLEKYFVDDNISHDLIKETGYLGRSFYHKSVLCFSLGLITKQFHKDLLILNDIRNYFAHSYDKTDLQDSIPRGMVTKLAKNSRQFIEFFDTEVKLSDTLGKSEYRVKYTAIWIWMFSHVYNLSKETKTLTVPLLEYVYLYDELEN